MSGRSGVPLMEQLPPVPLPAHPVQHGLGVGRLAHGVPHALHGCMHAAEGQPGQGESGQGETRLPVLLEGNPLGFAACDYEARPLRLCDLLMAALSWPLLAHDSPRQGEPGISLRLILALLLSITLFLYALLLIAPLLIAHLLVGCAK